MVLILFIILSFVLTSFANLNTNNNNNDAAAYFQRAIGSKLDSLILRLDHLESKLSRLQGVVNLRFDTIENSLEKTELRINLLNDKVEMVEEKLSRKLVSPSHSSSSDGASSNSFESRMDGKIGQIRQELRRMADNQRRHFDILSQTLRRNEENIVDRLDKINKTLGEDLKNQTICPNVDTRSTLNKNETFIASTYLLTNKITNMFEDLMRRSNLVESKVEESLKLTNVTRLEIYDGLSRSFGQLSPPVRSNNNQQTAAETISLQVLSSVESLNTAVTFRLRELTRSMVERFEIVSNTLDIVYDNCNIPAKMEAKIALILDIIIDNLNNSSFKLDSRWAGIEFQISELKSLLLEKNSEDADEDTINHPTSSNLNGNVTENKKENYLNSSSLADKSGNESAGGRRRNKNSENERQPSPSYLDYFANLGEEDKKYLWENLFSRATLSHPPRVPEQNDEEEGLLDEDEEEEDEMEEF